MNFYDTLLNHLKSNNINAVIPGTAPLEEGLVELLPVASVPAYGALRQEIVLDIKGGELHRAPEMHQLYHDVSLIIWNLRGVEGTFEGINRRIVPVEGEEEPTEIWEGRIRVRNISLVTEDDDDSS